MATNGSFNTSGYSNRYLTFSWSIISQSPASNNTIISWTLQGAGGNTTSWYKAGNFKVIINGAIVYSSSTRINLYNGTTVASGTATINHNNDGSKTFSASAEAGIYTVAVNCSGSGSWELPQIARASSVSGGSGNIGGKTTINIARADSSFTHILKYSFGSLSETIATGVGASYIWNIPTTFYTQIPNSNSGTGIITCETYSGNTKIGTSSCQFTATVINSNPTFLENNISYQDSNSTITSITGSNQYIVRNLSNLKVTITSATSLNSASISKYDITFNNVTKSLTSAGTVDFGVINLSSDAKISVKVTDSRGNSTIVTKTVTILNWELPTANISAKRINNYEDDTNLKINVSISSVNSKNSIQSIRYRYKVSNDINYSEFIDIDNDTNVVVKIDKLYVWDFQVEIKDKFGTKIYNFQVAKGMPIMMIDVDLISVGINCFPVNRESLCVNGCDFLEYEIIDEWEE